MEKIDIQKKMSSYSDTPEAKIDEGIVRDRRSGLDATGVLWRSGIGRSRSEASFIVAFVTLICLGIAGFIAYGEYKQEIPPVPRAQMDAAMQHTIGGETVPLTNHGNK